MVFAFAFILAVATAGVFAEEPEKLVRGTNARQAEFPYMVSIRKDGHHHCGGAIVAPTVILTAAHCVDPLMNAKSDVKIVSATNSLKSGGESHVPKLYMRHSKWDTNTAWDYDIGAIILESPIEFNDKQSAIPIASAAPAPGSKVVVSAWGATGWPPVRVSAELQKLELPVLSQAQCQRYHQHVIMGSHICTYKAPGVGTCSGDSGSPLVQNGELVGVVSGGYPCARGIPDIFTNVNFVRDFVDAALEAQY